MDRRSLFSALVLAPFAAVRAPRPEEKPMVEPCDQYFPHPESPFQFMVEKLDELAAAVSQLKREAHS